MDMMESIPGTAELRDGDCLLVELEDIQCLGGPQRWILEFRGDAPRSVLIRTVGTMVIPSMKAVRLSEEQQKRVDEVLRSLSKCAKVAGMSYQNFKVSLTRSDAAATSWEYDSVLLPPEHLDAYHKLLQICRLAPHQYRTLSAREKVGSAVSLFGLGVLIAVVLLLRTLWSPIAKLYRLVMRGLAI